MAQRTKTIEYVFPISTTSVATATARDFTPFTLYIPENTSRTFRSVILEMSFEDNGTTASSLSVILQGIQIDALGRNDQSNTQTLTNSGENQSYTVLRDCTAYFQTNFTSTSHTVNARLTVTGQITVNATAKLIITYEYSDTPATTRIKTVKIPIDGNNGSLTTTLNNVGSINQIPVLDTFLPEASKVYRDIFFEIFTHTGQTTGTTSTTLNMRYDGATTISTTHQGALNSDYMVHRIDKLISGATPSFTTNAIHSVEASTSSTNAPFPCLGGVLVVTYEYDHSTSTRVINSIEVPAVDETGYVGGTTIADASEFERTLFIQEPGTITLVQSGILMSCIDAGAITLDIRNGTQTSRAYAHPATARCGNVFFMRRFDSGAVGSSGGYTFDRGLNMLSVTFFTTSATVGNLGTNVSGTYFINYLSDISGNGDGEHSHTTKWLNRPYSVSLVPKSTYTQTITPIIPETDYYTIGVGFQLLLYSISGFQQGGICFQGELGAGEGQGAGWYDFYSTFLASDTENAQSWLWARARDEFKRHPEDPETSRMNIETSRSFRFDSSTALLNHQAIQVLTYHGFLYNIDGAIANSSGGTITINLHRSDNGELVHQISRTGDGSFAIDWHDNTIPVYIVAIDADESTTTHSTQFFAGGQSALLDFAGGTTGPTNTYYAYAG